MALRTPTFGVVLLALGHCGPAPNGLEGSAICAAEVVQRCDRVAIAGTTPRLALMRMVLLVGGRGPSGPGHALRASV